MRALLAVALLGCQEVLLRDLPETEANEVVTTLAAAGVAGEKQGRGQRIAVVVPAGTVAAAWSALRTAGLPRPAAPPVPTRLVVGPTEARFIEQQQAARSLERVLLALPGVHDARVALGEAGAAVTLRGVADEAQVASLVGAAVPAGAKISIEISGLPPPAEATPSPRPGALIGLSAAVVALIGVCVLLLIRLRQLREAPMIAGVPLAPDGLEALAALITLRGLPEGPAPLEDRVSTVLATQLAPRLVALEPLLRLTRVVARRTPLPGPSAPSSLAAGPEGTPSAGVAQRLPARIPLALGARAPAARFLRRQARRWCIAQAAPEPLPRPEVLRALGLRAHHLGQALDPEAAGLWMLVSTTADPGRRRDLVALAAPEVARRVGHLSAPP